MKVEPKVILNFVTCQLAWSACVLGGANDRAVEGTLVAAAVVGLHLALAKRAAPEALLIAAASVIGLVWDSLLVAIGLGEFLASFLGALIVAVVIGAIAWSLVSKGLNDIKASNLSMKRTTRSVSQDAQVVKESF